MSDTKINEAAVEAAIKAYEKLSEWGDSLGNDAERECMRAALEAALPHLQPAKPESVRLRDELRERAEFEAWITKSYPDRDLELSDDGTYAYAFAGLVWEAWQAALAATGKQQVGTFPWENLPSYLIDKCEGDTISEEGIQRAVADMAKDARYCSPQQVGEVQASND